MNQKNEEINTYNIFVVDDDKDIIECLSYNLKKAHFAVYSANSGKEALKFLNGFSPDLIILDVMLPEITGIEILKKLKNNIKTKQIPVIMLTARVEEKDKINGLDYGADDYICKPFSPKEVISRINAVLRRYKKQSPKIIKIDNLTIDFSQCKVLINEKEIYMPLKEFKLLAYLAENTQRVITRKELLEKVWDYNFIGDTRTVDVHVRHLREKLGKYDNLIITVKGIGYRMKSEVK